MKYVNIKIDSNLYIIIYVNIMSSVVTINICEKLLKKWIECNKKYTDISIKDQCNEIHLIYLKQCIKNQDEKKIRICSILATH